MDTTTPGGKLIFSVFAAIAEFERELIKERVNAGLEAARKQGRVGGRPSMKNEKKLNLARKRLDNGETAQEVAQSLGISRATLYRWLGSERV